MYRLFQSPLVVPRLPGALRSWQRSIVVCLAMSMMTLGAACEKRAPRGDAYAKKHVGANEPLRRLPGDPSSEALDATYRYSSPRDHLVSSISVDPSGIEVIRTGLSFDWVPGATVGEINAILDSIDATIDGMMAGAGVLIVRIPDPGNLASYDLIVL